jgi:hypothetical protein
MKSSSLSLPLCVLALVMGLGCANKPNDAKISSDIQSKFSQDSGLSGKQLAVEANNGTVTLSGTVENDAQRDAASRQAASVSGVKQVINNLEVGSGTIRASSSSRMTETSSARTENAKPRPSKSVSGASSSSKKSRKSHGAEEASQPGDNTAGENGGGQTMANNAPPPPTAATSAPPAPSLPPPPKKMIVDQGTQLSVRLVDSIDSERNQSGDTFHATLNAPLSSDGEEVVPAGVDLTGHLVDVKSAGKFKGQSVVVLQLDSITAGGKTYNIQTDQYKKEGSSRGKNTAEKVGGGAAIGAIIGAIAGGGKGAAIGAAAGGGVGGGVQAAGKGQQIKLPSETVLNFTLQAPVTIIQAPNPNADRQKLGASQ